MPSRQLSKPGHRWRRTSKSNNAGVSALCRKPSYPESRASADHSGNAIRAVGLSGGFVRFLTVVSVHQIVPCGGWVGRRWAATPLRLLTRRMRFKAAKVSLY